MLTFDPLRSLLSTSVCLLPLLSSCATDPYVLGETKAVPTGFVIVPTPTEGALSGVPAYGSAIELPGQSTEIIPYVRTEKASWFRDDDAFDEGGLSNLASGLDGDGFYGPISVRWHNAVFRVQETGEQWLLLDVRGVISNFWIPVSANTGKAGGPKALLFAVTIEDSNGDGVLDDLDGTQLLITDADGSSPRVVTPSGTHLDRITDGGPDGAVVVHLREDRDGDGLFERKEIPVPYLLRLQGEHVAERFISADTDRAIEALLEG